MVRFTVDNRNRLIFYGNPVGYVKADTAVVDEMFRTDELNQYLSRMNLTPRWEDGIFDRLVSGEVTGEELAQSRKGCRIWQLKKDVDVAMRFIGYEDRYGSSESRMPKITRSCSMAISVPAIWSGSIPSAGMLRLPAIRATEWRCRMWWSCMTIPAANFTTVTE